MLVLYQYQSDLLTNFFVLSFHQVSSLQKTNWSNKYFAQRSDERYDILSGGMYFTGDYVYQDFLAFAPILSSLILDSNKKVTDWISNYLIMTLNRQCLI